MEKFDLTSWGPTSDHPAVRLRCPFCRHRATFDVHQIQDLSNGRVMPEDVYFGLRRCPNPDCHAAVFVVCRSDGQVLASFPPEVLDFDASGLPQDVLSSLVEAIQCHANGCYRAAAIMVRRTLEDVCAERGASGSNLKDRLNALSTKVILPKELLDGLDGLRLLGNDAAHIEAQTFNTVGQQEVELAIDVTKEVLKGVYQYSSLVQRLDALKRQQP